MRTTSQKHARLRELGEAARKNLYEMLRLADEILKDREYTEAFGGESHVIDQMQTREFAHFGGRPSLPEMLRAFRCNPSRETWEEYRHNIWAMIELSRPAKEAVEIERVNWKALAKKLEVELLQARAALEEQREAAAEYRRKCDELQRENGELHGRIIELDKRRAA